MAPFTNITVETSPQEAQNLIYILSTAPGSLFITLRHPSDHAKKRLPASTLNSVLGKVTKPLIRKQVRRPASPPPKKKKKRRGPFKDID